jgi:hypothetical protein
MNAHVGRQIDIMKKENNLVDSLIEKLKLRVSNLEREIGIEPE